MSCRRIYCLNDDLSRSDGKMKTDSQLQAGGGSERHSRSLKRRVRRFVAFVLVRIYGVRGSLKPPLGGPHAGPLYPLRYRWWKAMNWLYHWSGLPDKWWAWAHFT